MISQWLYRVPTVLKWFYPSWYIWDKKTSEKKTIYLTFDDGPIPEVTDFVLDTLSRKHTQPIPATFFCIGENIHKYPAVFKRIIVDGHAIGNHTYNHLQGNHTSTKEYIENTHLAQLEIAKYIDTSHNELASKLFRPPYGRIKKEQASILRKRGYDIIMYRVIGYDWDARVTPEQCLKNITHKTKNGDIIVLHDSLKAFKNIQYALPRAIDYFLKEGFKFKTL